MTGSAPITGARSGRSRRGRHEIERGPRSGLRRIQLDPALSEPHVNLGVAIDLCGDESTPTLPYRDGNPTDPRLRPLASHWRTLGVLGK